MSDTFIHELPLEVTLSSTSTLHTRFDAGGMLYNAILSESLRRLQLMKESKGWTLAKHLPRGEERTALFKKAIKKQRFTEYAIHHFLTEFLKRFPQKEHLDSQTCQKIASRAFLAAKEYSLGKRGRPRYKAVSRFSSIEGKSNVTGIRFKGGMIVWKKLKLKPVFNPKDVKEIHALHCKIKYVRLVRRRRKGRDFFYAQLILEGTPLSKQNGVVGCVGIDLGPSIVAVYSEKGSLLEPITHCAPPVPLKRTQRKISRSYEKNGKKTAACKKLEQQRAELQRKSCAQRKTYIGALTNRILSWGNTIHLEKLSYKNFQKNYGKSVGRHAPGQFVQRLCRKAENAGGKVVEINPFLTKLSQTCHACGKEQKKPLSQRWHNCPCGVRMQRDLYSAFLAFHVENNCLDRNRAKLAWSGAELLLGQTLSGCAETARDSCKGVRFGLSQRQSGLSAKDRSTYAEAKDVVGYPIPRALERHADIAIRTP